MRMNLNNWNETHGKRDTVPEFITKVAERWTNGNRMLKGIATDSEISRSNTETDTRKRKPLKKEIQII